MPIQLFCLDFYIISIFHCIVGVLYILVIWAHGIYMVCKPHVPSLQYWFQQSLNIYSFFHLSRLYLIALNAFLYRGPSHILLYIFHGFKKWNNGFEIFSLKYFIYWIFNKHPTRFYEGKQCTLDFASRKIMATLGRMVGKLWRRRISVDGLYNNPRDR